MENERIPKCRAKPKLQERGIIRYQNSFMEVTRLYGPAILYPNGLRIWCLDNTFHRADGPAVDWPNGIKKWHINHNKAYPKL